MVDHPEATYRSFLGALGFPLDLVDLLQRAVAEVDFLGFRVGVTYVTMDLRRVDTIREWPIPKSFRDI
jgi:hypothetical protein